MIIDYNMTNKFALNLLIPFLFLGWGRRAHVNHPTFRETFAGTPAGIEENPNPGQPHGKYVDIALEIRRR